MKTFVSASAFCVALMALLATAGPAAAEPTEAQLGAIKSNCRSDYMSNCWGVPKGAKAMQCLKEHMASLSSGCKKAVTAATAPKPAPAPAKTAPAPAPEPAVPAAPKPAPAQEAAPVQEPETKSASPAPREAAKPTAVAPAAKQPAPKAATPQSPPPPKAAKTEPPAASKEAPPIIGFIPPGKKLMVHRHCRQDLGTYCAGVDFGGNRVLHCLLSNRDSLTPDCQSALARLTD